MQVVCVASIVGKVRMAKTDRCCLESKKRLHSSTVITKVRSLTAEQELTILMTKSTKGTEMQARGKNRPIEEEYMIVREKKRTSGQ